ncbi:AAA domain-containing protein [Robbsia sp. KACC 23696]|uniref:AAA domain-containing protein n=1 Tax=Robbsia sp. KACC 23696 TaxID=3149231 RepID=UPI00325AB926
MSTPRKRLCDLFAYIEETARVVEPRGFSLDKVGAPRLHAAQLRMLPGVSLDIQDVGDPVWLRVERLEETAPPPVSGDAAKLIVVAGDPSAVAPYIDESAFATLVQTQDEAVRATFAQEHRLLTEQTLWQYLPVWHEWAALEIPRRNTMTLYTDLFALRHQLRSEQTANPIEFVCGIGIATWRLTYEGEAFDYTYPLLTQALDVELDADSMAMLVRPRTTPVVAEIAPLVACGVPGAADCEVAIREMLRQPDAPAISPFDVSSFEGVLKLAARALDSRGSYDAASETDAVIPPPDTHLVVTDRWTAFTRPKSNSLLLADLANIRAQLESGIEIPDGPLSLVTEPSDTPIAFEPVTFRGISGRSGGLGGGGATRELYFPMPYNQEQMTIAQRLETSPGVAVQGPPGTGKSHTVANLICDALARGKRVLVTSKGEPALEVLQAKIPEAVRPLTVALLSGDREGIRQFQGSIEAIRHKVSQLNPILAQAEIDRLHAAIDRTHSDLITIDRRVDEIAEKHLEHVEIDGASYRSEQLAEWVIKGDTMFAWFDDALSLAPEHAFPLSAEEALHLTLTRKRLGARLAYLWKTWPSADTLPTADAIAQLHTILAQNASTQDALNSGTIWTFRSDDAATVAQARALRDLIDAATHDVALFDDAEHAWFAPLRKRAADPAYKAEFAALLGLFPDAEKLIAARASFLERPVDIPDAALASSKAREAIARGAQSGKPFGMISFGAGEAKELLAKIHISSKPPAGAADWAHVQAFADLHGQIQSFARRWNPIAQALDVPEVTVDIGALRKLEVTVQAVRKVLDYWQRYDVPLPALAKAVFVNAAPFPLLAAAPEYTQIRRHLTANLSLIDSARARSDLAALKAQLAAFASPVVDQLRALVDTLGQPDTTGPALTRAYEAHLSTLRDVQQHVDSLDFVDRSQARIAKAGGVNLAYRIATAPVAENGEDAVLPHDWREAWNWARVRAHLQGIDARDELLSLNARRSELESGLARMYGDVVAEAAWLATYRNASPKVLQALASYAEAIRRIGQGTGPNANRYRRDAQAAMVDAAAAVPCWIMSHAKISESMPADLGAFDLVIVDEASQSNLWALPAIVRAKKILVVGDDKQVSPDGGFISSARIDELRQRFLNDQPYGSSMTPEKSLYDLAARVFASSQVMLREHFRCVPPIIAYSNQFYDGAIQPLRLPRASERLDPPLVDIFVPDGARNRRGCNPLEAVAIADEIAALLGDERYNGRSIGVVTLLGIEQAKLIDTVVRARFSPQALLERQFECGEASAFQGSERDIVFLSMVADRNNKHPLSGLRFEQRFNVAASRARDRMYLVRSVEEADLSPKDLRATLLQHFAQPEVPQEVDQNGLIALCESGFEREVFSMLVRAGYRVIPQVKSGAYRLDMVVEGANDARLAIECDGDAFHGPDKWAADMTRQRTLERAGWTFWRCFASTWILDKEAIFAELLARLDSMGIAPLGALAVLPHIVEHRVWRAASVEVGFGVPASEAPEETLI